CRSMSQWHDCQFRHFPCMAALPVPPSACAWRDSQFRHVQVPAQRQFCLKEGYY
ncbi:hypothetical protein A2U01_0101739, partial [Trifolium medium]|nr:hypothetical protein [Trifolium medium]